MLIRRADANDSKWITAICHQQFQVAHKGGMWPEDLLYYVDETFNEPTVKKDIEKPGNYYLVAVSENSEGVGCIKLGPVDLHLAAGVEDAIEISRVYLNPAIVGTGIGKSLMNKAIELALSLGKKSIWLHVYKENKQAILFYEKCGFVIVGDQDFPVRNSCPVGWVMKNEI